MATPTLAQSFDTEVDRGERFEFGENWSRFLKALDDRRIQAAETSLTQLFNKTDFGGVRFADVGSGSGLFSLAARRLGATVHSFDYDPSSYACTLELRRRYFPDDAQWTVQRASVLDRNYLKSLGKFDIVYSWGVLHHTGAMWEALENVANLVSADGYLCVSIYNDQGAGSARWRAVKKLYNQVPRWLRFTVLGPATLRLWGPTMVRGMARGRPFAKWKQYQIERGMSPWRDVVDWVGGFPFEVAKPEEIFRFYHQRGFALERLSTCGGGHGCNEFVFRQN